MDHWFAVPDGLGLTQAAALPMALATAYLHLFALGLTPGRTILINGAGGTIGYAAVQIALSIRSRSNRRCSRIQIPSSSAVAMLSSPRMCEGGVVT